MIMFKKEKEIYEKLLSGKNVFTDITTIGNGKFYDLLFKRAEYIY